MDAPTPAPFEMLSRGFLDDNLALLSLAGPTLDLVRAAAPSARMELLQNRTPALLHKGRVLGVPQEYVPPGSPDGVTVLVVGRPRT